MIVLILTTAANCAGRGKGLSGGAATVVTFTCGGDGGPRRGGAGGVEACAWGKFEANWGRRS